MKIDQIAYYVHDADQSQRIKKYFGLEKSEWITDTVVGDCDLWFRGDHVWSGESVAHLQFNYDLGIELEILTYESGRHWHQHKREFKKKQIFLSHVGVHMDGDHFFNRNNHTLQTMLTKSHTNPYLVEKGRTYYYEIHRSLVGHDYKHIWRIEDGK